MDLKIKDVADLLSVSETTIRRWLADGKIPAYKLNQQYRFSRIEIENWMLRCKIQTQTKQVISEETAATHGGTQQFNLYRAINRGGVFYEIEGTTKEEIIHATTREIAERLSLDGEVLCELLLDRESLMPTALGSGIAVPHSRECLVRVPYDFITVVFLKKPIEYGALDEKPVHTLFFLFAAEDKNHLQLLSKIAHFSSQSDHLKFLENRPARDALLEHVRDWESHLKN